MATMTAGAPGGWTSNGGPLRCSRCRTGLLRTTEGFACEDERCDFSVPLRDGVLVVRDALAPDNAVAAQFYDGGRWPKVRRWESLFWAVNGGERRAREVVLRRLPAGPGLKLLDVAIGDGVYVKWLPPDWSIVGIDISTRQLEACLARNAGRDFRLDFGEAEDLPFRDGAFDAVLSNGGFNHFHDPEAALREMARVARPGGTIVIADEAPDLFDFGHRLGFPQIDRWIASRLVGMGDDFAGLVERHRALDVEAIGRRVLADCRYEVRWRGGGYVMTGTAP